MFVRVAGLVARRAFRAAICQDAGSQGESPGLAVKQRGLLKSSCVHKEVLEVQTFLLWLLIFTPGWKSLASKRARAR